jgi:hypothetical protein
VPPTRGARTTARSTLSSVLEALGADAGSARGRSGALGAITLEGLGGRVVLARFAVGANHEPSADTTLVRL